MTTRILKVDGSTVELANGNRRLLASLQVSGEATVMVGASPIHVRELDGKVVEVSSSAADSSLPASQLRSPAHRPSAPWYRQFGKRYPSK